MEDKDVRLVQAVKKANELVGINQRLSEELTKARTKLKKLEEKINNIEKEMQKL